MSERLDKAIAALEDSQKPYTGHSGSNHTNPDEQRLMDIARIQATIAHAEATERLVSVLDARLP